jgi:histidinol-phosphate aminotransferase
MRKAVTKKTKIVFIGNPDNPSGLYSSKSEVAEFLKGFPEDVLVFFDEAYFEFVSDKDYPDTLALLKSRKNIIVARTFSKLYGLAGLRVGYAVASAEVAGLMDRAREPFNVTSVAQAAAVAAFKDEAYYKKVLQVLTREREVVCSGLESMGIKYSKGATNFIQVQVPRDSRDVVLALIKKGVIVRDMSVWGLQNYIRVTIGTPAENKRFLKALKETL